MKHLTLLLLLLVSNILLGQEKNSFEEGIAIRISQTKLSDRLYGVGDYNHFRNNFELIKQDFVRLKVFVGILEQYDFMSANRLLKYSFGTQLDVRLTPKSLFYISGQYISDPFSTLYEDTEMPIDPFFPTSEIGFGIDFQLKNNINLDIGNKTLLPGDDNSIFNPTPLNMTRAKLKIGF